MNKYLVLLIILIIYLPLFLSLAFHITLERQPFGGKIISTENCENGTIFTIESYHHRSYFQTRIEKATKTFMFSTNKDLQPEDGVNKSDINSKYLTPSLPLEENIVVIGVAKPEGTCIEKRTKTVTSIINGTTTATQEYYAIRKNVDYTIVIIGRVLPCRLTHLRYIVPLCR